METHELYARAYELAAQGCYSEASHLLDRCLRQDPAHLPAHREMAFVLKMMGKARDALPHRLEVKRLDPSDLANRYHLAGLYCLLGEKSDALKEVDELLALEPANPKFLALKNVILGTG